ncbi:hypothetical protein C8R45DRAFT_954662 [Mycena sanguinolenta]|nr:hypothetical protein C8R45DRAFT_954662 [Mycena sanguinolenta]
MLSGFLCPLTVLAFLCRTVCPTIPRNPVRRLVSTERLLGRAATPRRRASARRSARLILGPPRARAVSYCPSVLLYSGDVSASDLLLLLSWPYTIGIRLGIPTRLRRLCAACFCIHHGPGSRRVVLAVLSGLGGLLMQTTAHSSISISGSSRRTAHFSCHKSLCLYLHWRPSLKWLVITIKQNVHRLSSTLQCTRYVLHTLP